MSRELVWNFGVAKEASWAFASAVMVQETGLI